MQFWGMTQPPDIGFAQLRTLRVVFRLNSFSAAAEELGVTQSSVSYAIDRLRAAFGDPLFVRQGGRIAPTARCRDIVDAAARWLDDLDALSRPEAFEPARASGKVTISCNAYERLLLVPRLVRRLRRAAPGLRLDVVTAFTHGGRHLLEGAADLLLSPVEPAESGIYSEVLLNDRYVCLMDRASPLAARPMDAAAYLAAPHVVVTYGGAWRSPYRVALEAAGHRLDERVGAPSPADLPNLLIGTDLIATAPSRLSRFFGDRVRIADCPFPAPFEIRIFWAARSHGSPLIGWLRGLLHEIAGELDDGVSPP